MGRTRYTIIKGSHILSPVCAWMDDKHITPRLAIPRGMLRLPGARRPVLGVMAGLELALKKMNRNLNEAIFDIAKVEAIMFAFENTYLELDVAPADRARADMATDAFYALWDAIRKVSDDLDRLAGDCRVVDAIYAVNDVRRRVGTLKTED